MPVAELGFQLACLERIGPGGDDLVACLDARLEQRAATDTLAWLDWSLGLSSRVQFTQTYLDGHDATILIRHDEDAAA